MRTIIAAVVLAAATAGCGGSSYDTESPATPAATTAPAKPTATTVTERLAHWQDVVKSMDCPELADLEQKRLAIQFADQAESLVAIHDRQAELHC